ncbi:carboxypeptidase [Companilactobacillus sp. RD055328]|uniref:transglycosylase domain-containing protein n=1 Tax=Companilactobacillus sp. RD055328 TaxID=2916634 RepID=UPI001FC7EEF6|nr:transglycosylase domain-containing protein [Companilactobacillus sp. RD055328]GKQ42087.1 carboxypeptidase [Companilactobacillus sp. RD055328]
MNRIKTLIINLYHKLKAKAITAFNTFKEKNIEEPSTPHKGFIESIKQRDRHDIIFNINVFITAIRGVFGYLVATLIVLIGLGLGIGIGYVVSVTNQQEIPTYEQMRKQLYDSGSTSLYFDNDVKLGNVQSNLIRKRVTSDEMSPYLKEAIVATEDSYFYKHNGVVPKSILRAIFSDVGGLGSTSGGSTLTQQTVKMQLLSSETTWRRKATEILLSLRVDKYFSKKVILESYLNSATFGHNNKGENIGGVEMAAQGLFGVSAKDLSLAQAAYIAGLPQSPSIYTPYDEKGKLKKDSYLVSGMKRKDTVLFRMYRTNKITKSQYNAAKKEDLKSQFISTEKRKTKDIPYGYIYNLLSDKVRTAIIKEQAKKDGLKYKDIIKNSDTYSRYYQQADTEMKQKNYRVDSTINKDMYDNIQEATKYANDNLGTKHVTYTADPNTGKTIKVNEPVQNGSIVLDNKTGAILAFVGGVDFDESQLNHAFSTKRSPGSSIKPLLVYGPAIETGLIGSKSMLADFPTSFGSYKPTDYDNTIQNRFISAEESLKNSYNIPVIHLFDTMMDKKINANSYMKKMGVGLNKKETQQLGTSLGGLDTGFTVQQQASAFSTFANKGNHVDSYVINKITDPSGKTIYQHHKKKTKVFSKATSYIMQDMMKGVVQKGTASTLGYQLDFSDKNLFGKTGTSNDHRDSWFVGSTAGITISSWIGYDNFYGNNYTLNSNSTSTNLNYWAKIANAVNETDPSILDSDVKFKKPDSVKSYKVNKSTGTKAGTINYSGSYDSKVSSNTTSLYNKKGPKKLTKNNFAIGGTKKNYNLFWDHYFGRYNSYGNVTGDETEDDDNYSSNSYRSYQAPSNSTSTSNSVTTNNNTNNNNNTNGNNIADDTETGSGTGSGSGGTPGGGDNTGDNGGDTGSGSNGGNNAGNGSDPGTGTGNGGTPSTPNT